MKGGSKKKTVDKLGKKMTQLKEQYSANLEKDGWRTEILLISVSRDFGVLLLW